VAAQQQQHAAAAAAADAAGAGTAALRDPGPGGVVSDGGGAVRLAVSQPEYAVHITYCARGRALEGCDRVWAHAGHSGWSYT
jgi:hypothetical protein